MLNPLIIKYGTKSKAFAHVVTAVDAPWSLTPQNPPHWKVDTTVA